MPTLRKILEELAEIECNCYSKDAIIQTHSAIIELIKAKMLLDKDCIGNHNKCCFERCRSEILKGISEL